MEDLPSVRDTPERLITQYPGRLDVEEPPGRYVAGGQGGQEDHEDRHRVGDGIGALHPE